MAERGSVVGPHVGNPLGRKDRPPIYTEVTVQDFLEKYEVGETVGVGGFAVVKRGRDKRSGQDVAIKVVDKSRYAAGDNSLEREVHVLAEVDHPNCIKMFAVYVTKRKVYIITEIVTGGELLDRVTEQGNFSEKDAGRLIEEILQGVAYLHSLGIVHRDLKLENLILLNEDDDSPVKIADFGLSKFFTRGSVLSTMCGSPQYVAPEILGVVDAAGQSKYSPAVDMWSVGVILFILLSGYSPFDDDNDAILFEKIKSGKYDANDPIWDNVSDGAKHLVAQLLTVDASARLTAEEALQHPWLLDVTGKAGRAAGPPTSPTPPAEGEQHASGNTASSTPPRAVSPGPEEPGEPSGSARESPEPAACAAAAATANRRATEVAKRQSIRQGLGAEIAAAEAEAVSEFAAAQ